MPKECQICAHPFAGAALASCDQIRSVRLQTHFGGKGGCDVGKIDVFFQQVCHTKSTGRKCGCDVGKIDVPQSTSMSHHIHRTLVTNKQRPGEESCCNDVVDDASATA